VRGPDQTSGLVRPRAGAWLALLVAAASALGQEPALPLTDPIDLTADRIRTWDVGEVRWAILEGKAGVFQDAEGSRADRAVVRIARLADRQALTRVEVFAEGHARGTDGDAGERPQLRKTFSTEGKVLFKTPELIRLEAPPKDPLLARGFPDAVAVAPRASPKPKASPAAPGPKTPPASEPKGSAAPEPKEVSPAPDRPRGAPAERAVADLPAALDAPTPSTEAAQPAKAPEPPRRDPSVRRTGLDDDDGFPNDVVPPEADAPAPAMPAAPAGVPDPVGDPDAPQPPPRDLPTDLEPLPPSTTPAPRDGGAGEKPRPKPEPGPPGAILPFSQRVWSIAPRNNPEFKIERLPSDDGSATFVIRGGVNIVSDDRKNGTVDIDADEAVIWTQRDDKSGTPNPENKTVQDERTRLEVYLRGNVIFRQDKREVAGSGDQRVFKTDELYYDFRTERAVALNGEMNFFAPGLLSPIRTISPEFNQFRPPTPDPKTGRIVPGPTVIRAEVPSTTGSRFPNPGYKFDSWSVDITQIIEPLRDPDTGQLVDSPRDPNARQDKVWRIDARQNFFFIGPVPVFYWPHIVMDSDDLDPPLRNIAFRSGNYFGQQVLFDLNAFKILGIKRPNFIDQWNWDVDYLSYRGVGLGSELGWYGRDVIRDILDPYRKPSRDDADLPYFGYFDIWGIRDGGRDVLGTGPAIVTNGPPGAGKARFQRSSVPAFQQFRGRLTFRHMQSLLGDDATDDEDRRLQLEVGYSSDRYFLEEYYKRLFDSGLDQSTLAYYIRTKENRAFTVLTEANLMNWQTDTQWLPRLDYYRLGDSFFDGLFTYSQHSGADYANTHTASEVNNPNIFAFMPFDPVSNTFGPFRTGRIYTAHEVDLPINLNVIRFVPYAQGELVGWDNQLGGQQVGRAWGAVGARANVMAWRAYHGIDSELLNVHDLNHKINFDVDYRTAYSNVPLNRLGVQDDLDDNTYESTRRYFALTNYVGGLLPIQYDPRFLTLRRTLSPIAGSIDIQDSIQTVRMGVHQRLQTKRGPEGRRRVIDYMVFDVTTTYFPNSRRDNFGKPFGQNMYNYEWYIGDRTSIVSSGWFESFPITGQPILISTPRRTNDPFDLKVVNAGLSINRPPRGNIYIAYSIINTGPITTSALNFTYGYWLSPKWFSTFSTVYDFGNQILLGSNVAITRIGADFLTSVGLAVDPQRNNFTFNFELTPRFSPSVRFGSAGAGAGRFDSRFAPTQ
jgi:hypothetical protein